MLPSRQASGAGSGCWPSTPPTFPRQTSKPCRRKRASTSGGADGLQVQRRVAAGARQWLAPGGHVLIETSRRQSAQTAGILRGHGLAARVLRSEELGATVVAGELLPSGGR